MIECREIIESSQEDLFDLTQDYSRRLSWDPFPESYQFLNGKAVDVGLQLRVNAKNGHSMVVEYVSFKRPMVVAIKMLDGPWFISKFAGSWSFQKIDELQTIVIFKYNIVGAPNWAEKLLTPMVSFLFKKNSQKRLTALKHYSELKI